MKTAYIIGNGPSLTPEQLNMLIGKDCFGVNRIDLIYPKTDWRPTYYVRCESMDIVVNQAWLPSVKEHLNLGIPCYMSGFFKEYSWGYSNYIELKHCSHHVRDFGSLKEPDEWHMPMLCQFGGSLIVAMQIALNIGYERLVLLGCDLNYKDRRPSHFDPAYEHGAEMYSKAANRTQMWAHLCGINYHARRNLPFNVVNCTPAGDLHLYPRARLEDTL